MTMKISSFANAGDLSRERLVLRVVADIDIGAYAVLCSRVFKGEVPTAGRNTAYWFPDQQVKAGDRVVLYTKSGVDSKKPIEGHGTAHFFYWGLTNPLWAASVNTAVLLRVATWSHKIPDHPEIDSS